MKILAISNMYPSYMGGNFIHEQAKHLAAQGCELKVIVPAAYFPALLSKCKKWGSYSAIPKHENIDGISVEHPKYFRLPGRWFHPLSCYAQYLSIRTRVNSAIRDFNPDIIHAHSATAPGFIGLLLKKKYGLPLVCSLRGSDINLYPNYGGLTMHMTREVINKSDALISVSAALKEAANAIAPSKKQIKIIYNGCDQNSFARQPEQRSLMRSKLSIGLKEKVLAFVGNISEDKGVFELLRAFQSVLSKNNCIRLLLAGSGDKKDISEFNLLISSLHLKPKVNWLGKLAHAEIASLMSSADIFVFPSHHEGLPNAVLEAMSCGLPIIATRIGGIPEAVEHNQSGLLVPAKDVSALANAIEFMVKNADSAKEMGERGREIIKNKFNWQANAENMLQVYREIIGAK